MNKFAVVIPYFGTFPNYFNFWIASASYNNFIDWYIITDNKYLGKTPENIHFILTTFNDLKNKIQKLYSFEIKMEKPYKLCDYKPAYGEIFDDIIKDYEFWGYGDLDVIYGDLRKFIPFDNLDNYDRIFSCGHLTLLRNTKIITSLYRKKIQGLEYFQDAFSHSDGFTFDEWGQPSRGGGYYQICERSDIRIFNEISFADICIKYNRLVNNFGGDKFEVKEEVLLL